MINRKRVLWLFLPMISVLTLCLFKDFCFHNASRTIHTVFLILEIAVALCVGTIGFGLLFMGEIRQKKNHIKSPKWKFYFLLFVKLWFYFVIIGMAVLKSLHEYFEILGYWDLASKMSLFRLICLLISCFSAFEFLFCETGETAD